MSYKRSWTKIKVSISTNDLTKDNSPFLIISTKFGRYSKLYERHFQEIYDRNVSCKILQSVISEQSGAVEACWAHNPQVRGSKPRSASIFFGLKNKSVRRLFYYVLFPGGKHSVS